MALGPCLAPADPALLDSGLDVRVFISIESFAGLCVPGDGIEPWGRDRSLPTAGDHDLFSAVIVGGEIGNGTPEGETAGSGGEAGIGRRLAPCGVCPGC